MSFTPEPRLGDGSPDPRPVAPQPAPFEAHLPDEAPLWDVATIPAQAPTERFAPDADAYSGAAPEQPLWLTASMEKDAPPIEPGTAPAAPAPAAQQPYPQAAQQPYAPAPPYAPSPNYAQAAQQPYAPAAQQSYAPAPGAPAQTWAPPAYAYAPPRKRKVLPWVLGGVGLLVVIGIAVTAAILLVGKAAIDGFNPDYDAPEVSAGDTAANGGTLVLSDDAAIAFEVEQSWIDQTAALVASTPELNDFDVTLARAWDTADLVSDPSASVVLVTAGNEKIPLVTATLEVEHQGYISTFGSAAKDNGIEVTWGITTDVTTASGLAGLTSTFSMSTNGVLVSGDVYTFGRGNSVLFVQVMNYSGVTDTTSVQPILDTLRIDS